MKRPEPTGLARPAARLAASIPGFETPPASPGRWTIGVVPGEGIGPEVVDAALVVLDAVARRTGCHLDVRTGGAVGAERTLSEEVAAFCAATFDAGGALLCGPAGGRFVYDLRTRFDLYCKLVPLAPRVALADAAIVRPERLHDVDVVIVRENTSGLYAGAFGRREEGRVAYQECVYRAEQVARLLAVAVDLAERRRGRLAVVVKRGGVPAVSALWMEQAERVAASRNLALDVLDVDNASFQLVAHPQQFDVIAAPNLFGDVLADAATVLIGSRGMSYSANFGSHGRAAYQTGHGAAHDLAGTDRANPVAQILSAAMMLRESFGLDAEASRIEDAVDTVLASGVRTADVAGPRSRVVGTRALARCIAEETLERLPACAEVS
jgi:3-isopropylmalate dehydrogenase